MIAISYMLTSLLAAPLLGRSLVLRASGVSLLSGILIAAVVAPVPARLLGSRRLHWIVWGTALFFNTLSVMIEGAFFAPTLSPMVSRPMTWTAFVLFQSLATAGIIAWLFGQNAGSEASNTLSKRAWYLWVWRFLLSSFSYLLFYFIFGAINYALATKPFYAAHVSGLTVPAPKRC